MGDINNNNKIKTLDKLNIGDRARVIDVGGSGKDRQHLLDLGLLPGAELKVVKKAPKGDPIEIRLHNYELAIRESHASNISISQDNLYHFSCDNNCQDCKKNCIQRKKLAFRPSVHIPVHPGFGEGRKFHNKREENPLDPNKTINFALVGNQNCGKTTLFNALTGSNQHVGNFPGVTVDTKQGEIKGIKNNTITDLPGIYSLSPYSSEELVARDFILHDDVDCIINIVDINCLERSLYLTMQLMELDKPIVLALNLLDELTSSGGSVQINKLEKLLGIPVVAISALKKEGIKELVDHALHIAKFQEKPMYLDFCSNTVKGGAVHRALHAIMHVTEDHCDNADIPRRFAAEKIAEDDKYIIDSLNLDNNEKESLEHILIQMEEESGLDRSAAIADMRYSFILNNPSKCLVRGTKDEAATRSAKIDKVLTGKYTAIPMFIFIMCVVFFLTFSVFGSFFQSLFASAISFCSDICENAMLEAHMSQAVISFVNDAIFTGLGSVISFLPIIVILFFFLSLLEDSGYIARVAFVMDRLLRRIGLSGRSIVPLLVGFGCSVPAVMACRTLPSEKDRRLTILLIPFMSCSAKLPIYAFFSAVFFPSYAGIVMAILYFTGIIIGILVAFIFKGNSKPAPFILELPNYRIPSLRNVALLLWEKCSDFIKRAFSVILIATIIIWFLQSFSIHMNYVVDANESILALLSGFISPLFAPIGLGDWRIVTSLISGFMAKESVVSTFSVLYGSLDLIVCELSIISVISLLLFCLLYTPCVATIATIKHELGFKYSISVIIFQCLIAWIVCFIVYNVMSLII